MNGMSKLFLYVYGLDLKQSRTGYQFSGQVVSLPAHCMILQ